ncbi:hypothetical protein AVEN_73050-1 [Araneus ventricosus]|uniref:Uncharacterized protein n=1 Tax=Araneus ventricosus TaxID=182803 RepID=A0A4Y2FEM5_ARAVE|nr:hypothetical protein AVEN_73050-1 [Araneus ventricosus]
MAQSAETSAMNNEWGFSSHLNGAKDGRIMEICSNKPHLNQGHCSVSKNEKGPWWPSGKVSTSGMEAPRSQRPIRGRGGLVARSRPREWRLRGSKPDNTEDPPCVGPVARQIICSGQTSSHWCGAEVWRGGASSCVVRQLRFKITRSVPK